MVLDICFEWHVQRLVVPVEHTMYAERLAIPAPENIFAMYKVEQFFAFHELSTSNNPMSSLQS